MIQRYAGKRKQLQFVLLVGVMVFVGLFESLSTAWIAIYASILGDPSNLPENSITEYIEQMAPSLMASPESIVIAGSIIMAILIAFKNALRLGSLYITSRYSTSLQVLIGARIQALLLKKPYRWYIDQDQTYLQQLVQWRLRVGQFSTQLLKILTNSIIALFLIGMLIAYNPEINIPIILIIGILSFIIYRIVRRQIDYNARKIKKINQNAFKESAFLIRGFKDLKISGKEKVFYNRFRSEIQETRRYQPRNSFFANLPTASLESLGFIVLSGTIVLLIRSSRISTGEALSVLALLAIAAWRLLPAINKILESFSAIRTHLPFVQSVLEILNNSDDIEEISLPVGSDSSVPVSFTGLSISDMSFSYVDDLDKPALSGINLNLKTGEKLGLIGQSGCGKSTLVDIIAGLLSYHSGSIRIGPEDFADIDKRLWRESLGYLPQKIHMIHADLIDNILFGDERTSENVGKVHRALEMAHLEEIADRFVESGEILSEAGTNMSGGQMQRVGLARLLYRDAPVWIIDEGTGAIDWNTEKIILNNLFSHGRDKTIIMITHRKEALDFVDRVCEIRDGQIHFLGTLDLYKKDSAW